MVAPDITISVVSHRQNALVNGLLADLGRHCHERIAIVLTQNVPDSVPFAKAHLNCPVEIVVNPLARGFGANHNAAFRRCQTPYFCVANPDIRVLTDPFPELVNVLANKRVAVVAPLVCNPTGNVEDSARTFPTITGLMRKAVAQKPGPEYAIDRGLQGVDWVAGMFMLFSSDTFRDVGGFDEAYFLYYEDVDICRRIWVARKAVMFDPRVKVVHEARRASRKDLRLALHHLKSAIKYFLSCKLTSTALRIRGEIRSQNQGF